MGSDREELESRVNALRAEVESARASGNARDLSDALRRLANVERRPPWGRPDAMKHLEEAIELLRGLHAPLELSHAIRHLGIIHEDEGRLDEAEAAYEEALAIYRTNADRGGDLDYANAVRYPAAIKWQLGKMEEAADLWAEAYERYDRAGNLEGVVESAGRLALIAKGNGDHAAAMEWFIKAKNAAANTSGNDTLEFVAELEAAFGEEKR